MKTTKIENLRGALMALILALAGMVSAGCYAVNPDAAVGGAGFICSTQPGGAQCPDGYTCSATLGKDGLQHCQKGSSASDGGGDTMTPDMGSCVTIRQDDGRVLRPAPGNPNGWDSAPGVPAYCPAGVVGEVGDRCADNGVGYPSVCPGPDQFNPGNCPKNTGRCARP